MNCLFFINLFLANTSEFNFWKTTGINPAKGVEINDFNFIERISFAHSGKSFNAGLNQIKADVASWLAFANGDQGYSIKMILTL